MQNPDGPRAVLQGMILEVEEAYGHCPRALNYAELWNTDKISERKASKQHPLRPAPAPTAAKS